MNSATSSLQPLKFPAAVLTVTLALAAILLYGSGRFASAMEDAHSALEHQLTDANIRLQQLRNQEKSFRSDAEAFHKLELAGLKGPEQRLAWVDLLRSLPAETGVSRADYQLLPQRPFARLPTDSGGPLRLSATQINLQVEAAHEGRLLAFLDRLQSRTPGLLVTRSCQLEGTQGPVRTSCTLDWITLDP
jgi:hypothetical protein